MFVIPAAGRIVRDPISRKALPAEGREVPESTHWIRRLAAGDVVLGAPAPVDTNLTPDGKTVVNPGKPVKIEDPAKAPEFDGWIAHERQEPIDF